MTEIKRRKAETFHITKNAQMTKMVEEIMKVRGVHSAAEVIRFCITQYYFGDFRKEQFGYQGGTTTAKGRLSKATRDAQIAADIEAFSAMSDAEATKYLHDIGYFKPGEEDNGIFFMRTNEETGLRHLAFSYSNGSSTSDKEDMATLISNLKKVLKEKYKAE